MPPDSALAPVHSRPVTHALVPAEAHIEQVRNQLAVTRLRTRETLNELRAEIAVRSDWRTYVRANPGLSLATAFALGFLLGSRR